MRVKRVIYSLALIVGLGIMAGGCTTERVYSDQVKGVEFSSYKTYAWIPTGKDTTEQSDFNNDVTYQNIRQATDKEMAKRGYVLDATNPDLLLNVHANFEKREELVQRPMYSTYYNYYYPGFNNYAYYPGYFPGYVGSYYGGYGYHNSPMISGYDIQEIEYTEGTVVIDAIDRKSQKVIWRGWTEERLDDPDDLDELYDNVDNVFKKYPVKEREDS
jgi:hypothetical protein